MSTTIRLLILMLCMGLFSSCAPVRYTTPSLANAPTSNVIVTRYYRFAWGLVPGTPLSLEQCGPNGIKRMKVRPNIIDSLITAVTIGLVAPVRVKIHCAGPTASPQAPAPAPAPAPPQGAPVGG